MAYAWRHGLEFTLPNYTENPRWNPIYLQHLVNPGWNPDLPNVTIRESRFTYQELPFEIYYRRRNVILDGYWQSEKYFKAFRDRLLDAFGYPWGCASGTVSVHVRRGDYLTIRKNGVLKHPPVTKEWMERAMRTFPGARFLFFSDDIGWCQEAFGGRDDCSFSVGKSEEVDLIEMSQCEHQICSASTYSWWGAYLNRNPDKRVVMPAHWLSPGWGGLDTRDVVPSEWERMP